MTLTLKTGFIAELIKQIRHPFSGKDSIGLPGALIENENCIKLAYRPSLLLGLCPETLGAPCIFNISLPSYILG